MIMKRRDKAVTGDMRQPFISLNGHLSTFKADGFYRGVFPGASGVGVSG